MPRLVAKVEGKGNGVKTVIPNMVDIAKSLDRPPTCEFSVHVNDSTRVDNEHTHGHLFKLNF